MFCDHGRYRDELPQLGSRAFLTDGGIETVLTFHEGWELPEFAAFVLLDDAVGIAELYNYYGRYIRIALRYETGLILECPTWRASPRWGEKIGYTKGELAEANQRAVEMMMKFRDTFSTEASPMVVSGCIGPEGDGYQPERKLGVEEAEDYHQFQVNVFEQAGADMVSALTMTYVEEATGIALAAQRAKIPVSISFTLETDGRLPTGMPLKDAIEQVDEATGSYPAYYMINCAHPTHFHHVLGGLGRWRWRILGLRANASRKSHAELDAAEELDDGDAAELGRLYAELRQSLPNLNVLGGCCGTDHRHIESVASCCVGRGTENAVRVTSSAQAGALY